MMNRFEWDEILLVAGESANLVGFHNLQLVPSIDSMISPVHVDDMIATDLELGQTVTREGQTEKTDKLTTLNEYVESTAVVTRSRIKQEQLGVHQRMRNLFRGTENRLQTMSDDEDAENQLGSKRKRDLIDADNEENHWYIQSTNSSNGNKRSRLTSMQQPQQVNISGMSHLNTTSSFEMLSTPTTQVQLLQPIVQSLEPIPLTNCVESFQKQTPMQPLTFLQSSPMPVQSEAIYAHSLKKFEQQTAIGQNTEGSSAYNIHLDSSSKKNDPFSFECRIPLPGVFGGEFGYLDSRQFVRKRNERERTRVRNVNEGFERLRSHLPPQTHVLLGCSQCGAGAYGSPEYDIEAVLAGNCVNNGPVSNLSNCCNCNSASNAEAELGNGSNGKDRRLSKVETLRLAIAYIKHLQKQLQEEWSEQNE